MAEGVAYDGGVEFGFIAEVIIDGCRVHAGPIGDLFGGGGVAMFRENLAGGFNEASASFLSGSVVFDVRHDIP